MKTEMYKEGISTYKYLYMPFKCRPPYLIPSVNLCLLRSQFGPWLKRHFALRLKQALNKEDVGKTKSDLTFTFFFFS